MISFWKTDNMNTLLPECNIYQIYNLYINIRSLYLFCIISFIGCLAVIVAEHMQSDLAVIAEHISNHKLIITIYSI